MIYEGMMSACYHFFANTVGLKCQKSAKYFKHFIISTTLSEVDNVKKSYTTIGYSFLVELSTNVYRLLHYFCKLDHCVSSIVVLQLVLILVMYHL